MKGAKGLSVVSKKQFLPVNDIADFFCYKGEPTRPISGCATRDASVIFAISEDPVNNRQITHFYQTVSSSENLKHQKLSKTFPELGLAQITEVSMDGQVLFVGGIAKASGKPIILSCEFDPSLAVVSSIQLDFLNHSDHFKMKRIEGHDLYVVCCGRSFAILRCQQYKLILVMKYLQITV